MAAMQHHILPWHLFLSLIFVSIIKVQTEMNFSNFSVGPEYAPLFTIVREPNKNYFYVGGRNIVLHLDSNLNLISTFKRGPEPSDGASCLSEADCSQQSLQPNDYKVLVISERKDKLLACGTANQGECTLHTLNDISDYVRVTGEGAGYLVGSRKSAKVIVSRMSDAIVDEFFYVFHQYDERNITLAPPVISLRILKNEKTDFVMKFAYEDQASKMYSLLDILPGFKSTFLMSFVKAFVSGNFVYTVTNQQKSVSLSNLVRPIIGRMCYLKDLVFQSYVENELRCKHGDILYNKATSVFVDQEENVLYLTAVRTESGSSSSDKSEGTVLCKTSITTINHFLKHALLYCYGPTGSTADARRLDWNRQETLCIGNEIEKQEIETGNQCGPFSSNAGVRGLFEVPMDFVEMFEKKQVVLLNAKEGNLTLGDESGKLMRYVGSQGWRKYVDFQLSEFPIQPDTEADLEDNLFVLAGDQVWKVPTSCSLHQDCDSCQGKNDPLNCGWCRTRNQCTQINECPEKYYWSDNECPPVIKRIFPESGPSEGGTSLDVQSPMFTGALDEDKLRVYIGGNECSRIDLKRFNFSCKTPAGIGGQPIVIEMDDTSTSAARQYEVKGQSEFHTFFQYKDFKVSTFEPTRGPESGGTVITIQGENLDIGRNISITVAGMVCALEGKRNPNNLTCVTKAYSPRDERRRRALSRARGDGSVQVTIDSVVRSSGADRFLYFPTPHIKRIFPARSIL
ncbi:hypothetical protein EGW08_021523, partial [Elysia chlorotica]